MKLALAALLLTASAAFSERLTIGVSAPYPPFQMRAENGQVIGLDADLMAEICTRGGFDCTWQEVDFSRLFGLVESGALDIAVGGLGRTPARQSVVHMTCPYRESPAPKGTFFTVDPDIALAPTAIAVTRGSLEHGVLEEAGYLARPYADIGQALAALLDGREAAFFGSAFYVKETAPDAGLANRGTLPLPTGGTSIAVTRTRHGLDKRIDAILAEISRDGTLAKLQNHWLGKSQSDTIARCRKPALTS